MGETYLQEAILAETPGGERRPALCYIASSMDAVTAANDYTERIVVAAGEHDFPGWYSERLESFRA